MNQKYNTTDQIKHLNQRLNNNPQGILAKELPTEPKLIEYMQSLINTEKAIWCQHRSGWHFILLRNGHKPPMGISKWKWEL